MIVTHQPVFIQLINNGLIEDEELCNGIYYRCLRCGTTEAEDVTKHAANCSVRERLEKASKS